MTTLQGTMVSRQTNATKPRRSSPIPLSVAGHDWNLLRGRLQMFLQPRHQFHQVAGAMAIIQL
jgi:hypothetical protein